MTEDEFKSLQVGDQFTDSGDNRPVVYTVTRPFDGKLVEISWIDRDGKAQRYSDRGRRLECKTVVRSGSVVASPVSGFTVVAPAYRPPCPVCGRTMEVLLNIARCLSERCSPMKTGGLVRQSRVVGRIPDIWVGAGAKFRQYEGRDVHLVLNPDEVPLTRCLYSWMYMQYCSAADFDFSSKSVVRSLEAQIRDQDMWSINLAAKNYDRARSLLSGDHVLLLVR